MALFSVVLWAHIFSAIGWLGAAMVFGIIIGPSLAKLSPQARGEFMARVMPKYLRYFEFFSGMTILFGVITADVLLNGDFSSISFSTPFGLYITTGAILALIVFAVSFSVVVPVTRKIIRISESMIKTPGPPPPELMVLLKRQRVITTANLMIMILVTILMVAGAT
ncbi:MAG: hypothetical protein OK441_04335 [Thaumarchaeota archaeon]|nr:hypothetical protein [Nitrososphaerota archaeon]